MGHTRVQHRENDTSTTLASGLSSGTVSFASAIGAGRVLYLRYRAPGTTAKITALATTGVSWVEIGTFRTNAGSILQVWVGIVTSGGATDIAVTLNAALSSSGRFTLSEYSGLDTTATVGNGKILTANNPSSSASTTQTTGTVTPTSGDAGLLFAEDVTNSGSVTVPGAPWTALEDPGTTAWRGVSQDITSASGSAYSATFTGSTSVLYENVIIWHKDAAVTNNPPVPTISAPATGSHFVSGASITFSGSATDVEDGSLTGTALQWTSSINGSIGSGTSFSTSSLSNGTHTITLTATDSGSATGTAAISITVGPPSVIFTTTPSGVQAPNTAFTPTPAIALTTNGYTTNTGSSAAYTVTLNVVSGSPSLTAGGSGTLASGVASLSALRVAGAGTFTLTVTVGALTLTSGTLTAANFVTKTLASPPTVTCPDYLGGTTPSKTGVCCGQYARYVSANYDGVTPARLIFHWHGASQVWTGQTPGNIGSQYDPSGANGLSDAVLQMCGLPNYWNAVPGWAEGDWSNDGIPTIVVFPQYGNVSALDTNTQPPNRYGWGATAKALLTAILADLAADGFVIDASRRILSGVSGGSEVVLALALDDAVNGSGTTWAAAIACAAAWDVRVVDGATGRTDSNVHTQITALASNLEGLPLVLANGQGETNVTVDRETLTSLSSTRDVAEALRPYGKCWYLEYESRTNGASFSTPSHIENYSWPYFTTEVRNWVITQSRSRPAITWAGRAPIALGAVPHVSGDITDAVVPWPVVIPAGALPGLKSVANGGVMRHASAWDIAFYADSARTTRLKAFRVYHNLTTGAAAYIVGIPPSSGLNAGRSIYLGYGSTTVTWDVNVDGRLASDYRVRRMLGFGDGTTLSVQNVSQTIYPDRIVYAGPDSYTTSGSPSATTSPVGGAIVCSATGSKRATAARNTWWGARTALDSANLSGHGPGWVEWNDSAINALPRGELLLVRANGSTAGTQSLFALQRAAAGVAPALAIQTVAGVPRLLHGTLTVDAAGALAAGWNVVGVRLSSTTSRALLVNPQAGTSPVTNTTSVDLTTASSKYLDAGEIDLGYRNPGSGTETANADIAAVVDYAFADLSQDWMTAVGWAWQGAGTSYTIGAETLVSGNTAPTAAITAPANGASVVQGASVTFAGTGTDAEDGTLTGASLVWSSSVNGTFGTGTGFSTSTLTAGTHTITLTATDSNGATGTASRTLIVTAPSGPASFTVKAMRHDGLSGAARAVGGLQFPPTAGAVHAGDLAMLSLWDTVSGLQVACAVQDVGARHLGQADETALLLAHVQTDVTFASPGHEPTYTVRFDTTPVTRLALQPYAEFSNPLDITLSGDSLRFHLNGACTAYYGTEDVPRRLAAGDFTWADYTALNGYSVALGTVVAPPTTGYKLLWMQLMLTAAGALQINTRSVQTTSVIQSTADAGNGNGIGETSAFNGWQCLGYVGVWMDPTASPFTVGTSPLVGTGLTPTVTASTVSVPVSALPTGFPVASLAPNDPNYLVTTQFTGTKLVTAAAERALGGSYNTHDLARYTTSDDIWQRSGPWGYLQNSGGTWYNWQLVEWMYYARAGHARNYRRALAADAMLRQYQTDPNNPALFLGRNEANMDPGGYIVYYLLTSAVGGAATSVRYSKIIFADQEHAICKRWTATDVNNYSVRWGMHALEGASWWAVSGMDCGKAADVGGYELSLTAAGGHDDWDWPEAASYVGATGAPARAAKIFSRLHYWTYSTALSGGGPGATSISNATGLRRLHQNDYGDVGPFMLGLIASNGALCLKRLGTQAPFTAVASRAQQDLTDWLEFLFSATLASDGSVAFYDGTVAGTEGFRYAASQYDAGTNHWTGVLEAVTAYNPVTTHDPKAAGLNGLYLFAMAWLYQQTGSPVWKTRGDTLYAAARTFTPGFNSKEECEDSWWGLTYLAETASVPTPPATLVAPTLNAPSTVTASTAAFTWSAATGGTPAYTYQLRLSTNGGVSFVDAGSSTGALTKTLTGLPPGALKVLVRVFDAASGQADSNVVSFATGPALVAGAVTVGTLAAKTATVTWTAPSSGTPGYTVAVEYGVGLSPTTWTPISAAVSGTATLSGLLPATTYTVRKRVTDTGGGSAVALATFVTDAALTAGALSIGGITSVGATFAWTAATHGTPPATAQLQRSLRGAGVFSPVSGATASPVADSSVVAGGSYDYRVAYNDAGTGGPIYSNVVQVDVPSASTGTSTGGTVPAPSQSAPWSSAYLLGLFNRKAQRPAADPVSEATKYQYLKEAQDAVLVDVLGRCPWVLYGPPQLCVTTDHKVFTFGTDAFGVPVMPVGKVGIYESLRAIPEHPMREGVGYLNEGTQIRIPNDRTHAGTLYWRGVTLPADLSLTVQPVLHPPASRVLIAIEAARAFHESNGRPDFADGLQAEYDRTLPAWLLVWKRQFKSGGALVPLVSDRPGARGVGA